LSGVFNIISKASPYRGGMGIDETAREHAKAAASLALSSTSISVVLLTLSSESPESSRSGVALTIIPVSRYPSDDRTATAGITNAKHLKPNLERDIDDWLFVCHGNRFAEVSGEELHYSLVQACILIPCAIAYVGG